MSGFARRLQQGARYHFSPGAIEPYGPLSTPVGFDPKTWNYDANTGTRWTEPYTDYTASADWTTTKPFRHDGIHVSGSGSDLYIESRTDGATWEFADSLFGGGGRLYGKTNSAACQIIVEHCSYDPNDLPGNGYVVGYAPYCIRFCKVNSINDGIDPPQGTLAPNRNYIEYNQIKGPGNRDANPTGHCDGIQFVSGGAADIRGNWIGGWSNSNIIIKSDGLQTGFNVDTDPPIQDVLVDSNYFAVYTVGDGTFGYHVYVRGGDSSLGVRWATGITESVGNKVIPSSGWTGLRYKCTAAGTTGATEPAWPITLADVGSTFTDGTVTWEVVALATADQPPWYITFRNNLFEGEGVQTLDHVLQTSPQFGKYPPMVATTADRDAAVSRQSSDPSLPLSRCQNDGMPDYWSDARTWIVWEQNNRWAEDSSLLIPNMWTGAYYTGQ